MTIQLPLPLLAIVLVVTSPMLHFWEHAGAAVCSEATECCEAEGTSPAPTEPSDFAWECDCFCRVAAPQAPPCDIAELAARHLPGDVFAPPRGLAGESAFYPSLAPHWPVHFPPLTCGGDLCARLGRYLL